MAKLPEPDFLTLADARQRAVEHFRDSAPEDVWRWLLSAIRDCNVDAVAERTETPRGFASLSLLRALGERDLDDFHFDGKALSLSALPPAAGPESLRRQLERQRAGTARYAFHVRVKRAELEDLLTAPGAKGVTESHNNANKKGGRPTARALMIAAFKELDRADLIDRTQPNTAAHRAVRDQIVDKHGEMKGLGKEALRKTLAPLLRAPRDTEN